MTRILLALFMIGATAQAAPLPQGTIPFRSYRAESGLGNLSAMKLAQDASGYLWVATQEGLYRYDGTRFQRFGLEQGLPSTYVGVLHVAGDGTVWAGTFGGVARLRGERFEAVAGLPRTQPNAITSDDAGRVWVATRNGLLMQAGTAFVAASGWPAGVEATAVWFDARTKTIWSASRGTIGSFKSAWQWTHVTPADRIDNVVVDRDGVVWARSGDHLWMNFADATKSLPATSNNGYLSLDRRGNLWVPTDNGVAVHDSSGWRVIGAAEGLPTDWARDALEDREGSIWIASLGIHRILGRGELTTYRRANGLPNDVTWAFHRDAEGRLLVGTDLGLARSGGAQPWSVVHGTEGRQIRSVVVEPDGTIWAAGSPPQIVRIGVRGDVRTFGEAVGVRGRTILRLLRDRDGAIWAATRGGGLLRLARDAQRFEHVQLPNGVYDEEFRDVIQDRAGRVWAAGQRGLARLEHGTWRRFTKKDGLAHDFVAYVAEASNGDLWAAYFEPLGVARISSDGRVLRTLTTRDGLSSDKAFLVGEDTHGRLWVGTGLGIDVAGPRGVEHLGSADGLAGDDIDAQAFLAEASGDVFAGTSSGFTRFAAPRDLAPAAPPRVVISLARREQQNLYAEFSALSFVKPDAIEYEVRIDGLDDKWQHAAEPHARWSRMPPGDYRLDVRARLRPGAWSTAASVAFEIPPLWWQTWWARLAAVTTAMLLLWLGYRWRVALLRRRNVELQALVDQRTRELAAANESLMQLSVTDSLTGMHNRRFLDIAMPQFTSDSIRRHESLGRSGVDTARANADLVFFMIDLDHFKSVNDQYGHAAGDAVLQQLERLLRDVMRESDTLVRWGGEEFLFVARNASRAEAATLAERIRSAVERHAFRVDETTSIPMTCSIGFAAFPFLPEAPARFTWHDVVDVADACLYAAKESGRNRWIGASAKDVRDAEHLLARIRESVDATAARGEIEQIRFARS